MLVTISVGSAETFSTGLEKTKDPLERLALYGQMQHLCRKLLQLPVPTMCVMSGDAMNAGFLFALCHDYRTISTAGRVCIQQQ